MPIYDYACPDCDHRFDDLVAHDAPAPGCPDCGAATQRVLSTSFATPGVGRERADWSKVPFDRQGGGCCGGACKGHGAKASTAG